MNDNSKQDHPGKNKFGCTLFAEPHSRVAGSTTNLQIVLNTQKNPYLNQATQKNTCQIFLNKKNPGIENFKPKKILQSFPSLEIQSTPPGILGL